MLYGRPTKHIRHVDEDSIILEPQRFFVHLLWKYSGSPTSRTDGLDLKDEKICPKGSKITKSKLDILVTPETTDPQQLYIGRLKLSFHDILSPIMCGSFLEFTDTYQGTVGKNDVTNAITPHLYPSSSGSNLVVAGEETNNQEIGGSASGFGIKEWLLDDNIKHFINMKKVTVFDQRPLMGERWQRIPSKVRRINDGTFYALVFFNDSPRGATPANTQLTINLKHYWEEMAI